MKKSILYSTLILIIVLVSGPGNDAFAQTVKDDIKLGGGLAFGSGVGDFDNLDNDLGIRIDGSYMFTNSFRGAADFVFYFPKSEGGGKVTVWELNFNGNYLFINEESMSVYGLAGVNITGIKVSFDNGSFGSASNSEFGLNVGGGAEFDLDFSMLFVEAKIGGLGHDANQFVIAAGLRFPLGN